MSHERDETCCTCRFWFGDINISGRFCRRNAPVPVLNFTREVWNSSEHKAVWPQTESHEWCGEYKRKDKLEVPATDQQKVCENYDRMPKQYLGVPIYSSKDAVRLGAPITDPLIESGRDVYIPGFFAGDALEMRVCFVDGFLSVANEGWFGRLAFADDKRKCWVCEGLLKKIDSGGLFKGEKKL